MIFHYFLTYSLGFSVYWVRADLPLSYGYFFSYFFLSSYFPFSPYLVSGLGYSFLTYGFLL